jgi:membrane-associated phospholipid phosphatase
MRARFRDPRLPFLVLLILMCAAPCHAADGQDDGRRTLGKLPENLGRTVAGLFDEESVAPFVTGGVATGVSRALDDRVRQAVAKPGTRFGRIMDKAGGALATSLFVGGLFVAGQVANDQRFRDMTYDMAGASLVSAGLTAALKFTVRRTRPNGENRRSFPSGHASNAFALASVAERHYGWKAGAPAYVAAAAIGASRLVEDKHYLSDVVAGATVGYLAGTTTVRVNSEPLPEEQGCGCGAAWSLAPVVGPRVRGVVVSVSF